MLKYKKAENKKLFQIAGSEPFQEYFIFSFL